MTFEFDGKKIDDGSLWLNGVAMYDNFAITPLPAPTMPLDYTVTADLRACGAEPVQIPPMNGWPALPVPDEAKAGDRVAWTIRDGVVVDTQVNPPIPVE